MIMSIVIMAATLAAANGAPEGLQRLAAAYPDHIACYESNAVRFHDGTRMIYDPGLGERGYEDKLANASLADQMAMVYQPGAQFDVPGEGEDPGRLRHQPFFEKLYGASREAVRETLAPIVWQPSPRRKALKVTSVNQVNERLAAVSSRLAKLPESLHGFVDNPAGGFHWRVIAGTKRLSPHSFGIAVDINTKMSDYWRWRRRQDGSFSYRNRIPMAIVEAFEAEGFIWGGKWHHFDTMHFEYRPELFALRRAQAARPCD